MNQLENVTVNGIIGKLYFHRNRGVGFRSNDDQHGDTVLFDAVRAGDKRFKFEHGGKASYGHVGVVVTNFGLDSLFAAKQVA